MTQKQATKEAIARWGEHGLAWHSGLPGGEYCRVGTAEVVVSPKDQQPQNRIRTVIRGEGRTFAEAFAAAEAAADA